MINKKQFMLSFLLSIIVCILLPVFMFINHYEDTIQTFDTILVLLQTPYWFLPLFFGIMFFLLVFFGLYLIFRVVNFLIRIITH